MKQFETSAVGIGPVVRDMLRFKMYGSACRELECDSAFGCVDPERQHSQMGQRDVGLSDPYISWNCGS